MNSNEWTWNGLWPEGIEIDHVCKVIVFASRWPFWTDA